MLCGYPQLSLSIFHSIAGRFGIVTFATKCLAVTDVTRATQTDGQDVVSVKNICLRVPAVPATKLVSFEDQSPLMARKFMLPAFVMGIGAPFPEVMTFAMIGQLETFARAIELWILAIWK